jgi:hypothetical protein
MGSSEIRRIERWLGSARVFLAIAALVAIWMDPGEIGFSLWAFALLFFYIAQGVAVMLLLRRTARVHRAISYSGAHGADVVWAALILIFATGQGNSFFLFFVFVLAAAAYRWGLWETLATAALSVVLLWIESFVIRAGFLAWLNVEFARPWFRLPLLRADVADFEPRRLFMRSVYLLVIGLLLGYLAEQQKQLRAEKAVVARILGKARVEAGLVGTLQEIAGELLAMYGARQTLIASQEFNSQHVFVGGVHSAGGETSDFTWQDSASSDPETYLYDSAAVTSYARRLRPKAGGGFSIIGLDENGVPLRRSSPARSSSSPKSILLKASWWSRSCSEKNGEAAFSCWIP